MQTLTATFIRAASPPKTMQQPQHIAKAIPVIPFKPPQGYQPLDAATPSILTDSNLSGKQIWHITAPSSVPVTSIHSVARDAVQNGKPVLTHKSTDYILAEDTSGTDIASLFLPTADGYAPASQKVQRTLRLQQKITLPELSNLQAKITTGSQAAADVATAPVTGVRPQPTGLRMRYRPMGHVDGEPGMPGSESEDEGSGAKNAKKGKKSKESVQFPKTLGEHGTSEAAMEGKAGVTSPEATKKDKKDKKKRKSKGGEETRDDGEDAATTSAIPVTEQPSWGFDAISTKPQQDAAPGAEGEDTTMADVDDTVVTAGESREEKAKRKEEKRLRKEGKAAKKAKKESSA